MSIDNILREVFKKLIIISLLLVIFSILIGPHNLKIEILILILTILGISFIRDRKTETNKGNVDNRIIWLVLVFVFILSVFIRYYPYFWTNVPPGYDPGLYKYGFDTYISNLPCIPESTLPEWFKEMFPPGLSILGDILYVVADFESIEIITVFTPLVCGLMALPVFAVSKRETLRFWLSFPMELASHQRAGFEYTKKSGSASMNLQHIDLLVPDHLDQCDRKFFLHLLSFLGSRKRTGLDKLCKCLVS